MKKNIKRLTLKDISDRLGVSTATISNAFNRPDQLSAELRENILKECEKMGYFGPNAAARSLRTGRTGIVGVVLSDVLSYSLTDPVANQFLTGIGEVLEKNGYNMLLLSTQDSEKGTNSRMQSSMVDGFIVYGDRPRHCKNAPWLQPNQNVITVDSLIPGTTHVNVQNFDGAYKIASHALKFAPKNIAILGLNLIDTDRVCRVNLDEMFDAEGSISVQRLQGYISAFEDAETPMPYDHLWNVPTNDHRLAYQAAKEALSLRERPNLILCMSDRIALAAVQAALHMGFRVPEDLHIVGFDGIAESENFHPSITTMHQQSVEKGRIAAELFLGLREAKDVMMSTELVVRETCPSFSAFEPSLVERVV